MLRTRVAVAAIVALAIAGCSSSAGHSSASTGPASTSAASTSAASTGAASTSANAPSTPGSTPVTTPATAPATSPAPITADQLAAALLTPADLGAGFAKAAFRNSTKPLPCAPAGSPPFGQQAPTDLRAGTQLINSAQTASVSEELRVYDDVAHATTALRIGSAGLACRSGKLYATDGTSVQVKIAKAQDVTTDVGGTKAIAWDTTSTQVDVLFVVVQLNRALVLFSFVRDPGTDISKLPNALAVTKAAVQKIAAS